MGDDKRRPYGPEQLGDEARVGATLAVAPPESGGFVAFARGGVPRPCAIPYRPERGHRETGMGGDKRRPYGPYANSSATRPA